MDVDQEQSMSHNVDDHYDSVPTPSSSSIPDMNAMRGPPGSLNGEFGASSLGTMELQFKSLQRMVQEGKSLANLASQKADSAKSDASSVKRSVQSLPHLQKMVASQTDKYLALKKELGLKNGDLKLEEVEKKLEEQQAEILVIRQKLEELERKVESSSRSGGSSSGSGHAPDRLMQMIDAFERQLGMYDVTIAEMDLGFQVLENTSYNGVLVWKIKDYARRMREAVTGRSLSLHSQPFYTSQYGYKICARIHLNGHGMGMDTHMSLFFMLMKGDYDALLPWPFTHKVNLVLFDLGPDRQHLTRSFSPDPRLHCFKKPTSDMNSASGFPLFVAQNVIYGSSYIKEDTIFIGIQVVTSNLDNFGAPFGRTLVDSLTVEGLSLSARHREIVEKHLANKTTQPKRRQ